MPLSVAFEALQIPTKTISPGVHMPVISIGTWIGGTSQEDQNISSVVGNWLELGGRGIDTAYLYLDQKKIADTVVDYGVAREDLFITSKFPMCLGSWLTQHFLDRDLAELNTEYIDLMLVHFPPFPFVGCDSTWRIMEDYVKKGKLKAIGVSNWNAADFQALDYVIPPAVNQVEFQVFYHDEEIEKYCTENNITIEAYSALGGYNDRISHRSVCSDPVIMSIAKKHTVSAAQVALRWAVQKGNTLTVLSSNRKHQANDGDIFFFTLDDQDMLSIAGLNQAGKTGPALPIHSVLLGVEIVALLCVILCCCCCRCCCRRCRRNKVSVQEAGEPLLVQDVTP